MTQQNPKSLQEAQIIIRDLEDKNRDLLNRLVQHEMHTQCLEEIEECLEALPKGYFIVNQLKTILEQYR